MPIALLNRDKLRQLCDSKLEEAQALLEKRCWNGAYYFTGLAVECALKSCLASAVEKYDFPDKRFVEQMYSHDLERLFQLTGALWAQFQVEAKPGSKLAFNWELVKSWNNEKRYEVIDELDAKGIYDRATEENFGVVGGVDTAEMVMAYVETLMEIDIEYGRKVWQSLRAKKMFSFQGVFWLLNESGLWHLLIATPRVDAVGPGNAYEELAEITKDIPADSGQIFKIELISPKHPFYQALRSVYGTNGPVEGPGLATRSSGGCTLTRPIFTKFVEVSYLTFSTTAV